MSKFAKDKFDSWLKNERENEGLIDIKISLSSYSNSDDIEKIYESVYNSVSSPSSEFDEGLENCERVSFS